MISSVQPSVAQRERLEMLAEECAEVIHAVTKILRHGYNSAHPVSGVNNKHTLREELLDVVTVMRMMAFDVDTAFSEEELAERFDAKLRYTHAQ